MQQQILAHYGQQVRFIWRDLPIITAESPKAAEAGLCAYDQGQFWAYHDLLYEKAPNLQVKDLKQYAADLGLDTARFDQCLDSGKYTADVAQSTQDGYAHQFKATPAFLVNGKALLGPASFDQFSAVIDAALQAKNVKN